MVFQSERLETRQDVTYFPDNCSGLTNDSCRFSVYCWGALLSILVILGLLFRFTNLDKRVYWHDEAYTSLRAAGYTPREVTAELMGGPEINAQGLLKYQQPNPQKSFYDSLRSSIVSDPIHPPLYYLITRLWMQWIGYSPAAMRSLAAIISIFVLPGFYWLGIELFNSRRVALLAVALICVSPIHILYAREAREYSLWAVAILFSSAALLRALRLQSKSAWAMYAVTLVFGLYSHLFFVFVAAAHGLYSIIIIKIRSGSQILADKASIAYFLASISAILAYTPLVVMAFANLPKIISSSKWTAVPMPFVTYIRRLMARYSTTLVDFEPLPTSVQLIFVLPILFLVGYSLYFLWKKGPKGAWLFVLLLIGTTAGALTLPDIILGGFRSAVARYLIPCFIGIQLAVAYLLTTQLFTARLWKKKMWQLLVLSLFLVGILSGVLIIQAESWWDKGFDHGYPQMVRIINKSDHPLLIVDGENAIHFGYLLGFGHELDSHVHVKFGYNDILDEYSDIFLYKPSPISKENIVEEGGYHLEVVIPSLLWQLIGNGANPGRPYM